MKNYRLLLEVENMTFRRECSDVRTAWYETYQLARRGQEVFLLVEENDEPRCIASSTKGGERLYLAAQNPDDFGHMFQDVYNRASWQTSRRWRKLTNLARWQAMRHHRDRISATVLDFIDRV